MAIDSRRCETEDQWRERIKRQQENRLAKKAERAKQDRIAREEANAAIERERMIENNEQAIEALIEEALEKNPMAVVSIEDIQFDKSGKPYLEGAKPALPTVPKLEGEDEIEPAPKKKTAKKGAKK